jgi:hypothetical protein
MKAHNDFVQQTFFDGVEFFAGVNSIKYINQIQKTNIARRFSGGHDLVR